MFVGGQLAGTMTIAYFTAGSLTTVLWLKQSLTKEIRVAIQRSGSHIVTT